MKVLFLKQIAAVIVFCLGVSGTLHAAPAPMMLLPSSIEGISGFHAGPTDNLSVSWEASQPNVPFAPKSMVAEVEWSHAPVRPEQTRPVPGPVLILLTGGGLFGAALIIRRQRSGLLP
ncbi:MAG: hypothetical protein SWH68_15370 [Thermodesulfobacteriota bacterium]|nr:hypothetical protein [Thermodesulfobacteriota bacterium]